MNLRPPALETNALALDQLKLDICLVFQSNELFCGEYQMFLSFRTNNNIKLAKRAYKILLMGKGALNQKFN